MNPPSDRTDVEQPGRDADHGERLFSYGTLQLPAVQQSTFGRLLHGEADALVGYRRGMVRIEDAVVVATSGEAWHPIVEASGDANDTVAGTVFAISAEELARADAYEVDDYRRVEAALASGRRAWVYVKREA
ncbi:gamma-glutamylcyclotransferase family protein [Lysobacter capsici]|uniref:gamma-glutamylcyclotransferase family protein n=1 Tax=Lysobacter capsici TaxID=435897 RepID=UPI000BBA795E|nr:gamma-glutamylcyclotransferase family protein [Lysobacter capsici]ATE70031.1 UDP-N-acetylmuramate--alanine ligase [Lysobacter capsici]